jgi:dTDP-4-dehydrorhamnose reductase
LALEEVGAWNPPEIPDVTYLCAAVTSLEKCRQDPGCTARINVDAVSDLAAKLAGQGSFLVFCSTNQVFDGLHPLVSENGSVDPKTEYGRQKAEAERRILALGAGASVVRLTKVLGSRVPLFDTWREDLNAGRPIHPFLDMVMAPIPLAGAVSVLRLVADRRLQGVLQVSAAQDVTYAEAAALSARRLRADLSLVRPIRAAESGTYSEYLPAHTTLSTERLRREFGILPPDPVWTIEQSLP